MNHYKITITKDAEADLTELRSYIANEIHAPDTALKYIRSIRSEISKLSFLPERIKLLDDEPWHSYGIRKIKAKNS